MDQHHRREDYDVDDEANQLICLDRGGEGERVLHILK